VWLPLTFAAVGRSVFLKYKFTDKRLSVSDTFPTYGAILFVWAFSPPSVDGRG